MSSHSVSPRHNTTFTMNPVDDGQVGGDEGSDGGAPAAHDEEVDVDTEDRQVVDGEVVGESDAAEAPLPHMPAPPDPHPIPRPRAKGVKHPAVPTKAQVERHALEQHVNYEAWCPHCAQASALMKQHCATSGESPSVPTVSAAFCFMKGREAESGDGIPVLVLRESQTRSLFSHACAGKSTTREGYSGYIIAKVVEDIDSVQKDVHLKTDQEPAMLALQARVQRARKCRTTPVNSPKGDHQANGRAEKAVQVFQNMARRMRLAAESHLGIRIPHKHPVLMWLIEWVGGAHNRFKEGRDDGKTPSECRVAIPEHSLGVRRDGPLCAFPFGIESGQVRCEAQDWCLAGP